MPVLPLRGEAVVELGIVVGEHRRVGVPRADPQADPHVALLRFSCRREVVVRGRAFGLPTRSPVDERRAEVELKRVKNAKLRGSGHGVDAVRQDEPTGA